MYGILDFYFHNKIFNRMMVCRKPSKLITMVWSRP